MSRKKSAGLPNARIAFEQATRRYERQSKLYARDVRNFVRAQLPLWRQVPALARRREGVYQFHLNQNKWQVEVEPNHIAFINCRTGSIVGYDNRSESDDVVLKLAQKLDEIDAERVIEYLSRRPVMSRAS